MRHLLRPVIAARASAAAAAAVLALLLSAGPAAALSLNLTSITPEAGGFRWTYTVSTAMGEGFMTGPGPADFLSLVDFAGYVPGTAISSLPFFAVSYVNLSPAARLGPGAGVADPLPAGLDDPTIGNLLFTYTRPPLPGPQVFTISAVSTFSALGMDVYSAQLRDVLGADQGFLSQRGPVAVPVAVQVIPEPGTLSLLAGASLASLGGGAARRRRRGKAA